MKYWCIITENEIHCSLFKRPRHQFWSSQLQYRYLYYWHRTERPLLDDCFCCRNLHSRKSTTRKSTFGSSPPDLIWKKILSKSRQNSWKMPAKEPTLLQSCRLEAYSCTKSEPSHSHPPAKTWVIIFDYFKNLRRTFIPEYFLIGASIHYAFFLL